MITAKWQKSLSCGLAGCIEVKKWRGIIHIRDTKKKKVVIQIDEASWSDFIRGVKNNEFDLS